MSLALEGCDKNIDLQLQLQLQLQLLHNINT